MLRTCEIVAKVETKTSRCSASMEGVPGASFRWRTTDQACGFENIEVDREGRYSLKATSFRWFSGFCELGVAR